MRRLANACGLSLVLVTGTALASARAQATRQNPLPAPTGPYAVGRTQFDWIDPVTGGHGESRRAPRDCRLGLVPGRHAEIRSDTRRVDAGQVG